LERRSDPPCYWALARPRGRSSALGSALGHRLGTLLGVRPQPTRRDGGASDTKTLIQFDDQDVPPCPKFDWRGRSAPLPRGRGPSTVECSHIHDPVEKFTMITTTRSCQHFDNKDRIFGRATKMGDPSVGGIFGRPSARTTAGVRAGPREAALTQAQARILIHELGSTCSNPPLVGVRYAT
jgi:hypothetical protein